MPRPACQQLASKAYSLQVTSSGCGLFKQEKQEHVGSQGVVMLVVYCTTPQGTFYKMIIDLYIYSGNFPENSNKCLKQKMALKKNFLKILYKLAK